jgi:hypothetical protein
VNGVPAEWGFGYRKGKVNHDHDVKASQKHEEVQAKPHRSELSTAMCSAAARLPAEKKTTAYRLFRRLALARSSSIEAQYRCGICGELEQVEVVRW